GGAGILESFINRSAFHDAIRHALVILHEYDDKKCDRACYECLCNYYNQQEHELLDRKLVMPILRQLLKSEIINIADKSPSAKKQFDALLEFCESTFEKEVLKGIYSSGFSLPDSCQKIIAENDVMIARPDFIYSNGGHSIAIFVDGPDHDREDQKRDDEKKRERLDLMGYTVLSINYKDNLKSKLLELFELLK
ncbi:MAG: DEAD/DEAH box helicase, partial [Candidatus Cloacimonetes bacterium]|nr:DEAD/DEAH box helicase [Candidatus Cloacimonadota bacterium]